MFFSSSFISAKLKQDTKIIRVVLEDSYVFMQQRTEPENLVLFDLGSPLGRVDIRRCHVDIWEGKRYVKGNIK
jgi:hypothetical protein